MASLEVYVVTFNCARELVSPDVFAQHFFNGLGGPKAPDILIVSLQEIAPIAYSFLGGSYLEPYFERIRATVNTAARSFDGASYINIITRNLGMTAIMAFVLQDQTQNIDWIETAGVGVGLHGMGNKGAVGLTFGHVAQEQETKLCFVAAHLAPMEDAVERRNEDWKNLVRGLVFTPLRGTAVRTSTRKHGREEVDEDSAPLLPGSPDNSTAPTTGIYAPTSHLVLAGDLNYRTSKIKPSPIDYQVFPQPTQDTTDSRHYSNLLKEDQLSREIKAQRTCHGLYEVPIDFPPTYKYSDKARAVAKVNGDNQWQWARHRWPSWCDRILYLGLPSRLKAQDRRLQIQTHRYTALPLMSTSDHRPVALSLSIPLRAVPLPDSEVDADDVRLNPPFSIDPLWRQKRAMARRKELVVGAGAFLSLTWEGRIVLLATIVSIVGGWWVIASLL
jgi:hypothetical protein